ncbi:MAG: UvrD-helicase domain-containing protein [Clostridiales bacterium]|nr:UvrD-helicase domain-containing protein [Clostridiales bacterium]
MSKGLSDQKERDKIVNVLDKNFLVEAGAGSGKTYSLVSRMISLVKNGVPCENIVAITFTRKAAGELRERFQLELEDAISDEKDNNIRANLLSGLTNLENCFIDTIHSFCGNILRERPIEAMVDPNFDMMDDSQDRMLKDRVWVEYIKDMRQKKQGEYDRLESMGIDPNLLKRAFEELSEHQDVDFKRIRLSKPPLNAVANKLRQEIDKLNAIMPTEVPKRGWGDVQKRVFEAYNIIEYVKPNDLMELELLRLFERITSLKVTQYKWGDKAKVAMEILDEIKNISAQDIQAVLGKWREYCHYEAMGFALSCAEYYHSIRHEEFTLSFQDLLLKTRDLLRDNPEVRAYFADRYSHLLVDEFQDTDPIQAEIIFYLTGEDIYEKQWQELKPKPGSLFVVGDPKQSIYRFRRADISIYNLVGKLIEQSGGEILILKTNFRTVAPISNYLNPIFEDEFSKNVAPYQASYTPMESRKKGKGDHGVYCLQVRPRFSTGNRIDTNETIKEDAKEIALYIEKAMASGKYRPKDFLILTRLKSDMNLYADALRQRDIPFQISGASSLGDCIEIGELSKLFRFLSDPNDNILFAAVLRGMFFGLTDQDLYEAKQKHKYIGLYIAKEQKEEDTKSIYDMAREKIIEYRKWTGQMLPSLAMEKIIEDLNLIPYLYRDPEKEHTISYIYQILEYIRAAERDEGTDFYIAANLFDRIYCETMEEELNLDTDTEDIVRLMNLHKAKGLEGKIVFLANPIQSTTNRPNLHIQRLGNNTIGSYAINVPWGRRTRCVAQPENWNDDFNEEVKYLEAEETRLLYVAATRAEEMLIISDLATEGLEEAAKQGVQKQSKKSSWARLLTENMRIALPIDEPPKKTKGECSKQSKKDADCSLFGEDFDEDWNEALKKETYLIKAPSDIRGKGSVSLDSEIEETENTEKRLRTYSYSQIEREAGGGKDWGLAVHQVFEELIKGREDIDSIIDIALMEYGFAQDRVDEMQDIIQNFKQSKLWSNLSEAKAVYPEMPFALRLDPEHKILEKLEIDAKVPVMLNGVIDLIYKDEQDRWVVVDYKTDRVVDELGISSLVEYYTPQLKSYCLVWEEITGEPCSKAELYFVHSNITKKVT